MLIKRIEDEILSYSYITYILSEDFHFIIIGEIFRGEDYIGNPRIFA